jgi:hypothetical protein
MLVEKERSTGTFKNEAKRYQPSFDLRKNIARVLAHYSVLAVQKDILLDIFVTHETPNYFHGNKTCFLEMLSQLLKHCIESMDTGEITIRINHDSFHQKNNCETKLSIIITSYNKQDLENVTDSAENTYQIGSVGKYIPSKNNIALHRIGHLCGYFDGEFSLHTIDDHRAQYILSLILHQTPSAGITYLA